MQTCWTFFFLTICRPAQALQRSLRLIFLPFPRQLWHLVDICCIIPGMICCMWTCTPVPWQVMHVCSAPVRQPWPAGKKETIKGQQDGVLCGCDSCRSWQRLCSCRWNACKPAGITGRSSHTYLYIAHRQRSFPWRVFRWNHCKDPPVSPSPD